MSLIHDALRRGQPAAGGRSPRAAHPDSVLAALGYRHERTSAPRLKVIVGLVLAIAAAGLVVFAFSFRKAPAAKASAPRAPAAQASVPRTTVPAGRVATPAAPVPHPAPLASRSAPPVSHPAPSAAVPLTANANAQAPVRTKHAPARLIPPAPPPPGSATAPDDFQLALYYQRSGDFEQALVHYKAVIGRDELNVEAHNNLGRLYLDKGLTDEAIREFQRVTAIDPRYTRARINLAAAYFKQGRYDLSAAEARAALAVEPRNVDALVNLALAEKAAGQLDDAREGLLAALRIDPRNAAAHYNLGRQYEEVGESALALSHYEAFLKYAGPDQAAYAPDVRARIASLSAKIK